MFFVYILQSEKDESFYVGFSADPKKRLREHNKGKEKYTKAHMPYIIVHVERFITQKEAKDREAAIKKTKNIGSLLKKQTSSPDRQNKSVVYRD